MRQWKLANPWGNLRSGDPSDLTAGFIAGRLVDALRLNLPPYNPLLVASDSSGVWLVSESGGPAIPLSWTWTAPQLNCLARGYYEERHVYAGGVGLYETDVTSPAPLYAWRAISLMGMDDHPAPVGTILRMVVVRERGMLVLATSTGVWWVRIAQTPGGPYVAMQAMGPLGQPMPGSAYSCVVEGPNTSVVAACWGTNLVNAFGIFVGDWSGPGGGLQFFTRATIQGTKARQMLKTELAVCVADRNWRRRAGHDDGPGHDLALDREPAASEPVVLPGRNQLARRRTDGGELARQRGHVCSAVSKRGTGAAAARARGR